MTETISCPRCHRPDAKFNHEERFAPTDNWIVLDCPDCGTFPYQVK